MSKVHYLCIHANESIRCKTCIEEFGKVVLAADPEREGQPMTYGRYAELFRQGKQPQENLRPLDA